MWAKAKSKEKAEISRIAAEAREKLGSEAEARVRGNPTLFIGQRQRLIPISEPE